MQREWNKQRRVTDKLMNKQYYKPHYGPEETQEVIQQMRDDNERKIKWTNNALRTQLDEQYTDSEINKLQEDLMDRQRLQAALELQHAQDDKQREKEQLNRENLRRAWEEQMAYRDAFKQTDDLFK